MNNDIKQAFPDPLVAAHKPFSYLAADVEPSTLNEFVELTLDISAGIETCLNLVFSHELARDCLDVPAIGPSDSANLLRLSIAVNKLLRDEALRRVEYLNEQKRTKRGAA